MEPETRPLRLLIIGAHPDDCEFKAGGLAAKCRERGDIVKFVSATNGEAGHHKSGGGPLICQSSTMVGREFLCHLILTFW